jgi:hypothetical protein
MGRKRIDEKDKAKLRPASLKDEPFNYIKAIGKGSFSAGIMKLVEQSKKRTKKQEDKEAA